MMRSAFACFLVLAVLSAVAREVTPEMAQKAVQNWRASRDPMGCRFGKRTASSRRCEVGSAKFNVVKMEDGGFVVTSADTAIRPIVFFSDGEDVDENPNNPLYALLKRDLEVCAKAAADAAAAGGGTALASTGDGSDTAANERAWAELLVEPSRVKLAAVTPSDIRVGPLCATTWNQETVGSKRVYNYYTPNNVCCGCVATAAAQIMRYFEWPKSNVSIAQVTNPYCKVEGETTSLTTQGGTYNWSDMPLQPSYSSITETQQQAIGKLCSDVGIVMAMSYTSGGSGTGTYCAGWAFKNVFQYTQAVIALWSSSDNKTSSSEQTRQAFLTNFDAKLPVQIGMTNASGGDGHSIVADGYGYSGSSLCYHLNYGWGGSSNGWYCPPTLGSNYTIIDDIVYNIYTNQTANSVIVSGRLLGTSGGAASGVTIEARQNNKTKATATTDAKGIFALYVSPSQTYTIRATQGNALASTNATTKAIKSLSIVVKNGVPTGSYWGGNEDAAVCNVHVGDMRLVSTSPVARIGSTDYYSFAEACDAATSGQTVSLLQDVEETITLTVPATIDFGGHTLTGEFYVQNTTGTATLRNGTITGTGASIDGKDGTADTFPGGTVCFSNMTVTGTIWSDSHPLIFDGGTYTGDIRSGSQTCTIRSGSFASLLKDGDAAFAISGGRFGADFSSVSTLPNNYWKWLETGTDATYPWLVTGAIDYATPTLGENPTLGTNFTRVAVSCSVAIPYRGTDGAAQLQVVATDADGHAHTNRIALAAGTGTQNMITTFDTLAPAASYALTAEVLFGDGSTFKDVTMDAEVLRIARKVGAWIAEDATTFANNPKWTIPAGSTGVVENATISISTELSLNDAVLYTPTARPYDCAAEVRMRVQLLDCHPDLLPAFPNDTKFALAAVPVGAGYNFAVWSSGHWTTSAVPCEVEQEYEVTGVFDYARRTVDLSAQTGSGDPVSLGRYSYAVSKNISEIGFIGHCEVDAIDGDGWDANLVRGTSGVEYATLEAAVAAGETSVTLLWDCTWSPNTRGRLQVLNPNDKGFSVDTTRLPSGCILKYNAQTNTYIIATDSGVVIYVF